MWYWEMLEVVLKDLLEVVLEDVGSGAIGSAKCGAGRCWKWCSGKLEAKDSLRLRLQSLYATQVPTLPSTFYTNTLCLVLSAAFPVSWLRPKCTK